MDVIKLINIKEEIEKMDIINQKQILKILCNNSTTIIDNTDNTDNTDNNSNSEEKLVKNFVISENNNGTFVNLSELNEDLINKLEDYIKYFHEQQNNLFQIEKEKINLKNEFFNYKSKSTTTINKTENNKNRRKKNEQLPTLQNEL